MTMNTEIYRNQKVQVIGGEHVGNSCIIEDLWKNINGEDWKSSAANGNPGAMIYAIYVYANPGHPLDEEVFYVHINSLGYLIHRSHLDL